MQTKFSPAQLADPEIADAEKTLRSCVHCGFCTATCPTYTLLGDELDSPRGRIYLIKDMLENDRPATKQVVKHIDRCLSCLSCMSTCPSGVNYMHLIDQARHHVEKTYRRPFSDRVLRGLLGWILPRPTMFRLALHAAKIGKVFGGLLPSSWRPMLDLAPTNLPPASPVDRPRQFAATKPATRRVAMFTGCAQKVIAPAINEATVSLLTRHGCDVVVARGAGCCGALNHHLGQDSLGLVRANVRAWAKEARENGLDAIVINASGCGTTIKDYGHMLRNDPEFAEDARLVSSIARDITELMTEIGLGPVVVKTGQRVAYHSACSLQHGQQVRTEPKSLLRAAGFDVVDVPEAHLCCGSAGTYNLLQPEIAGKLRDRKVANIQKTKPELIAAGNIGCITQIGSAINVPVIHTVELLDWATGGATPAGLNV